MPFSTPLPYLISTPSNNLNPKLYRLLGHILMVLQPFINNTLPITIKLGVKTLLSSILSKDQTSIQGKQNRKRVRPLYDPYTFPTIRPPFSTGLRYAVDYT